MKDFKKQMKLQESRRQRLFKNIQENKEEILSLHKKYCCYVYEDRVYRFYHASLKVFWLQDAISDTLKLLHKLSPRRRPNELDEYFIKIIEDAQKEGEFKREYNEDFSKHARPVLEAYFHCKYFIDMLVKSLEFEENPRGGITSGWGAILELYNLRY